MAKVRQVIDWILRKFRTWQRKRVERQLTKCLESETTEEFLKLLLRLMSLSFRLDADFRRNIEGFNCRYQFKSKDNSVAVAAIFANQELNIKEKLLSDADLTVIFKDSKSIMNYLLAQDKDILKLLLNNEVVLRGNANYLFKFMYLANHLQLALTGQLP